MKIFYLEGFIVLKLLGDCVVIRVVKEEEKIVGGIVFVFVVKEKL